ncbi:hypothetical protein NC653_008765 [Populus alba x Populus x berolinensis]|uniref:Secreted protein n=1 Tax=Populus alba x Populus x berolinensis TaxID=444605 RepID=A0AAD6R8H6_9ROSI|nr:hypothetical protein NC653_008765 [Populus alba x Populus x berolinensis]
MPLILVVIGILMLLVVNVKQERSGHGMMAVICKIPRGPARRQKKQLPIVIQLESQTRPRRPLVYIISLKVHIQDPAHSTSIAGRPPYHHPIHKPFPSKHTGDTRRQKS